MSSDSFLTSFLTVDNLVVLVEMNFAGYKMPKIKELVKIPYTAEALHFSQAQLHCNQTLGLKSVVAALWDPQYSALSLMAQLHAQFTPKFMLDYMGVEEACDLNALRAVNALSRAAFMCFLLQLIQRIGKNESKLLERAGTLLPLYMFPPLAFYSSLFTPHVLSTLLVLMSLALVLKAQSTTGTRFKVACRVFSAIAAAFSLGLDQTNILWAIYTAITALEEQHRFVMGRIAEDAKLTKEEREEAAKDKSWTILGVVYTEKGKYQPHPIYQDFKNAPDIVNFLVTAVLTPSITVPYSLVVSLFGVRLLKQNELVWPDFSVAPLVLFALHALFFTGPIVFPLYHLKPYVNYMQRNIKTYHESVVAIAVFLHLFSGSPQMFTPADNQHFSFYFYTWLIQPLHESIAFAGLVAPVLHMSLWLIWPREETDLPATIDGRFKFEIPPTIYTQTCFVLATLAAVSMSPLFQTHCYIVPYIIWRARHHRPVTTEFQSLFETVWYTAINIVSAYLFLYKPFTLGDTLEIYRYSW